MPASADRYIKSHAKKIPAGRRYLFHVTGECGWINDPNGFSFHDGKIHLFYQHYPYATHWGPMHWGHVTSTDFVDWTWHDVALAPGRGKGILGCFSGSAIDWGGMYHLVYTRAGFFRQEQCLATSVDGYTFVEAEDNPVIPAAPLPAGYSKVDFRDPKVWVRNGVVHMIVSDKIENTPYARLLLYRSTDLHEWKPVGTVLENGPALEAKLGRMLECPDFVTVDGQELVIVSPQDVPGHPNKDGSVWIPGRLDDRSGAFSGWTMDDVRPLDCGLDFYAPQTMAMPDGRTILVAWMQSWNRRPVTSAFGYAGALTLPRELSWREGRLYQSPVRELALHHADEWIETIALSAGVPVADERLNGACQDLGLTFEDDIGTLTVTVFADDAGHGLELRVHDGSVTLDRTAVTQGLFPTGEIHRRAVAPCPAKGGKIRMRLILDRFSCEAFLADGFAVLTATCLPGLRDDRVIIQCDRDANVTVVRHAIRAKGGSHAAQE